MSSSSTSVHLAFVLVWTLLGLATSSTFTSSPEPFNNVVQNRLTLTCKADIPKNIISIEISKDNQRAIATINNRDGLGMGPNAQTNMEGEGHIERDATKTFLAVTIRNPTVGDAGTYVCHVFYFTPDQELKEERIKINTTFDDQDVTAMVKFLTSQLEGLKKTVHDQEALMKTQNEKIQNRFKQYDRQLVNNEQELAQLKNDSQDNTAVVLQLKNTVAVLNQTVLEQETSMLQIRNRPGNNGTTRCAFSARYKYNDKLYSQGSTLKFRNIDTNIGNGYNGSSGDFTAPYDGVYVFTLVVMTASRDDRVQVSIRKNTSQILAVVYAQDKDYNDQTSTSCVVSLTTGDTIRPSVDSYGRNDYLYPPYSTFSGFLLYPS